DGCLKSCELACQVFANRLNVGFFLPFLGQPVLTFPDLRVAFRDRFLRLLGVLIARILSVFALRGFFFVCPRPVGPLGVGLGDEVGNEQAEKQIDEDQHLAENGHDLIPLAASPLLTRRPAGRKPTGPSEMTRLALFATASPETSGAGLCARAAGMST